MQKWRKRWRYKNNKREAEIGRETERQKQRHGDRETEPQIETDRDGERGR